MSQKPNQGDVIMLTAGGEMAMFEVLASAPDARNTMGFVMELKRLTPWAAVGSEPVVCCDSP